MRRLARVAIGSVQPGCDVACVSAALMAALVRAQFQVRHFTARACFLPQDAAPTITGQETRHLDTWLSEPEACRALFTDGACGSNLAFVTGRFRSALDEAELVGGDLSTLCDWLDLPRVAIIDAAQLADCQLPQRPAQLDGVLVIGTRCPTERHQLQTNLESLWGVPVLGFSSAAESFCNEVAAFTALGGSLPNGTVGIGAAPQFFAPSTVQKLLTLASSREYPYHTPVFAEPPACDRLRIAIAYDDAFHWYFPDTLDQLELLGAELLDFSPLRDERLPPEVDLVYFGCGHPELFSHQLAQNCCLIAALSQHVANGGRLYAECGGLAYLGQHIELPCGRQLKMSGVMPLVSLLEAANRHPQAVELELADDCWLGPAGGMLRGYRSGRWHFERSGADLHNLCLKGRTEPTGEHTEGPEADDLMRYQNAIGSRLHLNFAMQPRLMERFFSPAMSQVAVL